MSFYSPLAFIMGFTIPAVILLYMLKQRFEETSVSSIYLWQQALNNIEANAPWQKLKRSLLMLLQITAMLLFIMALANPYIRGLSTKTSNLIIAIDTSMSMQAADTKPSRFHEAKKRAASIVSNMKPGSKVTLVAMGANNTVYESLNTDKNSLQDKINSLEVTNAAGNIEEAAALLSSLSGQFPNTKTYVIGDTPLETALDGYEFINVGNNGDNYALVHQAHVFTPDGITALTRLGSFSSQDSRLNVSLYVDGQIFDSQRVQTGPGEFVNIYWDNIPQYASLLECRLESTDSLNTDNIIYDVITRSYDKKAVLVTDRNIFLEKAFSLVKGLKLYKSSYEDVPLLSGYDLYVYDGMVPEKLPDGNVIILNPHRNDLFGIIGKVKHPGLYKPEHELFKHIKEFPFTIGTASVLDVPSWGEEMLNSDKGAIIFGGIHENRRIIVFGFDVHDSNIVLKPAFPILISDIAGWLLPDRVLDLDRAYPHQAVELNLNPVTSKAYVYSPSGVKTQIAPPFPSGAFEKTYETGVYKLVQEAEGVLAENYFTVNCPQAESDLKLKLYKTNDEVSNTSHTPDGSEGMPLINILLWTALPILLIEWWVYSNAV